MERAGGWLSTLTREHFLQGYSLEDTDDTRNVTSEIVPTLPVLELALGSSFASRLAEDTRGVPIKFVTDAELERMAGVIDGKNNVSE